MPALQDKVVVFTPKAGPSPFYQSFVAGDIRLDIRRLRPGDVICGDANGVVVVPQEFLEELLTRLERNRQTMHDYEQNVKRGKFSNEWVDETLTKLDCFRVD